MLSEALCLSTINLAVGKRLPKLPDGLPDDARAKQSKVFQILEVRQFPQARSGNVRAAEPRTYTPKPIVTSENATTGSDQPRSVVVGQMHARAAAPGQSPACHQRPCHDRFVLDALKAPLP
jgi:hypothetical protein